jgi:ABC-type multidrug transport system fused ATPase/permease subunit
MATFVRLLGFLRDYRRGVWLSGILAAAAMGMTVAIPALTGAAINAVDHGDRDRLRLLALAIAGAGLVRLALTVARRLIAGRVSLGVELDLRNGLYEHLLALELGFFDRQQTGQLMSRATVDLQAVRFFLGYGLVLISQSALTIGFAAVAMVVIDPLLALIALSPVPFVVWIAQRYGRRARPALQEVQQRIAELTADVEENVGGVRVVKAFAREERQLTRFTESVSRVFEQSMISTRLRAFYNPFIGFLPQIGLALLLLLGGRAVIDGSLSLGAFTAFYTYLLALLSPVRTLGVLLGMSQRATASGARIFELLDRKPRIVAAPDAGPLPPGHGRVELRNVSLTYEGAAEPALRDVSLTVDAGTTIALVGATGSGKTTLTALVGRIHDVTAGRVTLDGVDVRDLPLAQVRSVVSTAFEDATLFSMSVRENLTLGRPGASDEEVDEALRVAQADFVHDLPWGLATRIGEQGLSLSGGQRQRLALARAVLGRPSVLILDDPLSALDVHTEALVEQALRQVLAQTTALVVAHRPSTVLLADRVALLSGGRITAIGRHSDLLAEVPEYRDLLAQDSELADADFAEVAS